MLSFTYSVKITSNWANGRPSPELVEASPGWAEFIHNYVYLAQMSRSIWPDSNTVIRYFADNAIAQEYITALTNLCTFLNRNDWSYTLENGSITGVQAYGADNRNEWSTPWVSTP